MPSTYHDDINKMTRNVWYHWISLYCFINTNGFHTEVLTWKVALLMGTCMSDTMVTDCYCRDAWVVSPLSATGPRFTNGFSIAIQIRWKFRFTLTSTPLPWSLQNFVHGTTAVLSWHVQKFVAIWWPATELWQGEVSIVFELRAKNR